MRWRPIAVVLAFGLFIGAGGAANAQGDGKLATYSVGDLRSGYTYAKPETQAIQDDDFENPAFLWIDYGATLWDDVNGEAGNRAYPSADWFSRGAESLRVLRWVLQ